MVIVDVRLPIIVGAGTVLLWTGIYSAKHNVRLIDSMRLWRLVTLLIAVGLLMIVPRLMLGGVCLRVMCLVQRQMFLLFVLLVGITELLSAWFDSKQSRDIVELPQTCHPRPAFCGIAIRARGVERHLMDLDPNGGVDPSGCFHMFFSQNHFYSGPEAESTFS